MSDETTEEQAPDTQREAGLKRLNIYVPKGKKVSLRCLRNFDNALPAGIEMHCIPDSEEATICELGFTLNKFAKIAMTQELVKSLIDD